MRFAVLLAALALPVGAALGGCSTASPASPPSGVDGLVVPTPSPRAADFVDGVTNPWFPLPAGARWTYAYDGASSSGDPGVPGVPGVVVTTSAGPDVEGVGTTAVRTVARPPDGGRQVTTDLYAQDAAGNVWWFAHAPTTADVFDPAWRAGTAGAEAGLLVPATPRFGDGYRSALVPGRVDDRATVASVDGQADTPSGSYTGLLVVDTDVTVGEDRAVGATRRSYARGTGLVATQPLFGDAPVRLELAEYRPPS